MSLIPKTCTLIRLKAPEIAVRLGDDPDCQIRIEMRSDRLAVKFAQAVTINRDQENFFLEASEDLDAKDAVNIWDDGGTFKIRKADASLFDTRADGFVTVDVLVTQTASVTREGKVEGFAGLIPGPVFLGAAGAIIQTDPTDGASTGEIWQQLGTAVNDETIAIELGPAIELVG